jgi:SAM-dependent methyltransferase
MYGAEFAEVYDLLYGSKKDYAGEAEVIRELIKARLPGARSLLDVGCGTGEHLKHLAANFDVAGVEASLGMIQVAWRKLPWAPIWRADMRAFELGRTFDVVCSMYGCVGYLNNVIELEAAMQRMAAHTRPGGLVIFEPWIFREDWSGHLNVDDLTVRDGKRLARMGNWTTEGDHVSIDLHYLYGDAGRVRHFVDQQRLSLFTKDDYLTAAKNALAEVEYLEESPSGRGMFVCVR